MATICGSDAKRSSSGAGSAAGHTTASCSQASRQRRASPAGAPSRASATPPTSSQALVQEQRPAWTVRLLAGQRIEQPLLDLRPDARHRAQPPGRRRLAQFVPRAYVQGAGDLERALGAEPEVEAEPDQVGPQLTLELGQLGDLAGLDQLAQAPLDARPDPPQPAHLAGADEAGHRELRRAHGLRGPPVGARGVGIRVRELEQRGEGLEALGDGRVVEVRCAHTRNDAASAAGNVQPDCPELRMTPSRRGGSLPDHCDEGGSHGGLVRARLREHTR